MDAVELAGVGATTDASTDIPAPTRAVPYDRHELGPSYLADARLSLQAKGVLTIITNFAYEQIVDLQNSDQEFKHSLDELRKQGYVGRFDSDMFEVRLSPGAPAGGDHGQE